MGWAATFRTFATHRSVGGARPLSAKPNEWTNCSSSIGSVSLHSFLTPLRPLDFAFRGTLFIGLSPLLVQKATTTTTLLIFISSTGNYFFWLLAGFDLDLE